MLDELFTNGIGCFGEFHVTRPGGDRLLWVEWTDGLIPVEADHPGCVSSRVGSLPETRSSRPHSCQVSRHETLKSSHSRPERINVLSAYGTSPDLLRS